MSKKIMKIIATSFVACTMSVTALASGSYVKGSGGMSLSSTAIKDKDYSDSKFKSKSYSAPFIELAYGMSLDDRTKLEFSISHDVSKKHTLKYENGADKYQSKFSTSYTDMLMSASYELLHEKDFAVYAGAGAGFSFFNLSSYERSKNGVLDIVQGGYKKMSIKTGFALQGSIGASYMVLKNTSLHLDYKARYSSASKFTQKVANSDDLKFKSKMRNIVSVGVSYGF